MRRITQTFFGWLLALSVSQLVWADNVTLNLKDADISALITTVSEVTGTNFIVDPRVKGKVTVISARPMNTEEVYQVFLSILKVHGYAAVPTGEVVKVVPDVNAKQDSIPTVGDAGRQDYRGDEMVTQVVQIDNVSAAQLVPILRPLVPQQGHLAAYPATNVLIISDRADNVARLVNIVRRMDQQSDSEVEVIPLQHASAVEVVRILTSLQRNTPGAPAGAPGAGPVLIADERTNSVLLGGDRADRLRLRAVIAHLDMPLDRGGNIHVVYLKYAKAEDLVKVLTGVSDTLEQEQKQQQARPGADVNIQADAASNALVITAQPDVFRSLQSVIRRLDVRRAQVYVEAVIAELTADKAAELGVQWRATDPTTSTGGIGGTSFDVTTPIGNVATNPLSAGNGISLGYFEGTTTILGTEILNLGALVQALASDSETNILSTPTLVTLDNEEAEIVVAQNVPFVTGQFTNTGATDGATNPFQTIQREDVGLTLKVKPQINEGNSIRLDIEQESSSVSETAIAGASDIVTNKRSIKTSVMVEDKQVVVLGGLIDDRLTETVQKVPLLGDIPVLGNLFKSQRTSKTKQNLMVFLRPTILRDAVTETQVTSGKYNYMRAQQLHKQERGVNLMRDDVVPVLPEMMNPDGNNNDAAE